MKTDIKEPIKRFTNFWNHHINESTFKIKWKLDGAIYAKYHSLTAKNKEEALRYSVGQAIVAIVKILKQCSDNPTQEEVLEPFKIAVAREFGVTEEEYYKRKEDKANEHPMEKSSPIK